MQTPPVVQVASTTAWLESTPRDNMPPLRAELTRFPFMIGRSHVCDLTIESTRISREHVRVERTSSGYLVVDLDSTNGTYVNGVKVTECPLNDGDLLTVANFGLVFHAGTRSPIQDHTARQANA